MPEVIMDSALTRVIESSQRVAQSHCKENRWRNGAQWCVETLAEVQ